MPSFRFPSVRVLASLAALAFALPALAVDRLVPSQYATIQAAIDAAVNGDKVLVSPGPYIERIDLKGKAITVKSTGNASNTFLSANGVAGAIVSCVTNESSSCVIEGFRIFGGNGPGIAIVSSSPTFRNCVITGNTNSASNGGGVAYTGTGGSPRIESCTFSGNVAAGREGGAIAASAANGLLTAVDCTFSGNQATGSAGGAIWASGTSLTLNACVFTSNTVSGAGGDRYGGAIFTNASLAATGCAFLQNSVSVAWPGACNSGDRHARGGAIAASAQVVLVGCSFTGNIAEAADGWAGNCCGCCSCYQSYVGRSWGGAVFLSGSTASTSFTDCSFANNISRITGGGGAREARGGALLVVSGNDPVVRRCTFTGNSATTPGDGYSAGGSIWYDSGSLGLIEDCAIAGSVCQSEGGAIFLNGGAAPLILRTTISNCSTSGSASNGGGIRAQDGANASLASCRITNCSSPNGGGMYTRNSQVFVLGTAFDANTSANGSAIRTEGSGLTNVPNVSDSYFCGNSGAAANWIVGNWTDADPGSNSFAASCGTDCNINGIPDGFEIANGLATDCDSNGQPDSCQPDCDGDQVPNVCEADCNANGLADVCEIQTGGGIDCNANGQLDACEIASGAVGDCDGDGIPNPCEADCDSDGQADPCEILAGAADCDSDGIPDSCQIASGDRNNDGIYDDCQTVAFENLEVEIKPIVGSISGLPSTAVCWRVYAKLSAANASVTGIFGDTADPLSIQATGGFYQSPSGANVASDIPCTGGGPTVAYDSYLTVGGECANEVDVIVTGIDFTAFNANGGISSANGIAFVTPGAPASLAGKDRRVLLMQLTSKTGVKPTTSFNLIGDNADGTEWFAYGLPLPNPTLVDCNGNGTHDALDISAGTSRDCNRSGVPDECEYANANADCDADGTIDLCEIFAGAEIDLNNNGIPDDCECLGDVTGDSAVNVYDVIAVIVAWGDPNPGAADLNGDGVANGVDLSLVLTGWGYCL